MGYQKKNVRKLPWKLLEGKCQRSWSYVSGGAYEYGTHSSAREEAKAEDVIRHYVITDHDLLHWLGQHQHTTMN